MFENVTYTRYGKTYSINELQEWESSPDAMVDHKTEKEAYLAKVSLHSSATFCATF